VYTTFEVNGMSIGSRLKELRTEKNLTQKTVSEALNISKPVLSQYETDQRMPSVERLISLARFYQASLDYICENVDEKNPDINKITRQK
jgi:transcriptional regulator with XRE-family HTH domain